MRIQEMFRLGMKRDVGNLISSYGRELELGPGNSPKEGCEYLELPEWDAECGIIPFKDEQFDVIHMYHFLEHCSNPISILKECERVLKKGGQINIVVPHCKGELAFEDIDHKFFYHEKTIPQMIYNKGYGVKNLNLDVNVNFIMAVDFRNLSIFTQLVKGYK